MAITDTKLAMLLEEVKALANNEGLTVRQSPSGSLYIRNARREEWRISDHDLAYDRNLWRNRQIIVRDDEWSPSSIEIVKQVMRGTIDWYKESI